MSSPQQVERTNLLSPALAERGWKLYERESSSPFRADNELLGLYTGGFSRIEDAIDKANQLTVEEDERVAISTDGRDLPPPIAIGYGIQMVKRDLIRKDGGTQPRSSLDMLKIEEYREARRLGAKFPPVEAFFD